VTHKLGGPNHVSRLGVGIFDGGGDGHGPHQYTMLKEQLLEYAQVRLRSTRKSSVLQHALVLARRHLASTPRTTPASWRRPWRRR